MHHTVQAYHSLSHMEIMSIILGQMVVWALLNGGTLIFKAYF
jgi:hypothetical protein